MLIVSRLRMLYTRDMKRDNTMLYPVFVLFFFFQAEDGIRDVAVTGVQTCALPIFPARSPSHDSRRFQRALAPQDFGLRGAWLSGSRGLHGPGQLGYRLGRRLEIRLHASQRHTDQQSDGDEKRVAEFRAAAQVDRKSTRLNSS